MFLSVTSHPIPCRFILELSPVAVLLLHKHEATGRVISAIKLRHMQADKDVNVLLALSDFVRTELICPPPICYSQSLPHSATYRLPSSILSIYFLYLYLYDFYSENMAENVKISLSLIPYALVLRH